MPGDLHVSLKGPLSEARFVERPNRFLVRARLDGATGPVEVHLPDPGRLKELLLPDARLWLRPADGRARRTRWTAVLVEAPGGELVSLDTGLPNRLLRRALEAGALEELAEWSLVRAEWSHGSSRLDFLLQSGDGRMALEVKSVTLVEDGEALFPDAVTARGARHVRELAALAGRDGWDAAVLFVVQRRDCRRVRAARGIDPTFADALEEARTAGVRLLARRCTVTPEGVWLGLPLPVA